PAGLTRRLLRGGCRRPRARTTSGDSPDRTCPPPGGCCGGGLLPLVGAVLDASARAGSVPGPGELPRGDVVPLGPFPEGMVLDTATGLVVVALHGPDGLAILDRDG